MGMTSGLWKRKAQIEQSASDKEKEAIRNVMLFTTDVSDALYLEPIAPLGLELDGVLTLQYALKRAIENIFQVESSEIGVQCMGGSGDKPNIFIYESAEGSLGVLSRFVEDTKAFSEVIDEAIDALVIQFNKKKLKFHPMPEYTTHGGTCFCFCYPIPIV